MNLYKYYIITILIFLLGITNTNVLGQNLRELNYKIVDSFSFSGKNIKGLAWEGGYLWVTDENSPIIHKLNPNTGEVLMSFDSKSYKIGGLTVEGESLYFCSNDSPKISKVSIGKENFGQIISTNEIVIHNHGLNLLNGLASYEGVLFYSVFAGWSSSIIMYDYKKGQELSSFFCKADDLTYDGKYLWCSDSQNGRNKGFISKYDINSGKEIAFFRSPGLFPSGLAYGNGFIWLADQKENLIYKILVAE